MAESNLTVLAVSAAGKFAGLVIPEFVKRGLAVRGLTHDPSHADEIRSRGVVDCAIGYLRDRKSMDAALQGVDKVFTSHPIFSQTKPNSA